MHEMSLEMKQLTVHLKLLLEESVLQLPLLCVTPLSPDDTTIVTPLAPRDLASVLNVLKVLVATPDSLCPHDMELDEGGYGSSDTSRIHVKNGSSPPVYQ